jgi:hypothetical protein
MPPANTTFATAVSISSLPFSVTQSDINDAGTNFTVYYKFTAPLGARVIGAWGFSGNIGAGYRPTIKPYLGPAGAPTQVLGIASQNKPIQFPVVAGNEYFLEFVKNINTAGPEHIDVSVLAHSEVAITNGDIVIYDDTAGFPIAIMKVGSDNVVDTFITDADVSGEPGDITTHGIMCGLDSSSNIKVLARDFTSIGTLVPPAGTPRIRTCRGRSVFYVGFSNNPSNVVVKTVTEAAAFGATTFTLTGHTTLDSLAANNTETILYYAETGAGEQIRRWDLLLNSAMSDLVAGTAGYRILDILYLADDTIIANLYNSATKDVLPKRYNTSGTLLNTYALGAQTASTIPRMAYALDDPTSFWIMTHTNTGTSIIRNVRCSDGVVLTTRNYAEYEGGQLEAAETATPAARFGNSFSCPIFIMAGQDFSGIYVLVPDKTDDTLYTSDTTTLDVKIPNPLFKTYLQSDGG